MTPIMQASGHFTRSDAPVPGTRRSVCDFAKLELYAEAEPAILQDAANDLRTGLYHVCPGTRSSRPTSVVTLVRHDRKAGSPVLEIDSGRRTYEGCGLNACGFALAAIEAPILPPDVLEDVRAVMRTAGMNVQAAMPKDARTKTIWVHAPLGSLAAANSIGNGLFSPDPPLDQSLLILPSIAVVEIFPESRDRDDRIIPACVRIRRLRAHAAPQSEDPMEMLRRMKRLRDLMDLKDVGETCSARK